MACFDGTITSAALGMDTNISVILPEMPGGGKKTRVIYLLHGMYANYTSWTRYTRIESYARQYGFAVVMPDAGRSCYTDMRHGGKYFTYVSDELPEICQGLFNISGERDKTFIAGLSMGGYGALKCAFTNPNKYRAAASFSGGCDLEEPRIADMFKRFDEIPAIWGGTEKDFETASNTCSLFSLSSGFMEKLEAGGLKLPLLMTCGLEDALLESNRRISGRLEELGADLDYKEWTGGHDWKFWDTSVEMALKFFDSL